MKDDEPTPEEQREAEALARALEGKETESAPPPETLEVAALLRHAHGTGGLDPARSRALAERLRREVRRPARRWVWALVPVLAGAAAVVLLVPWRRPPRPLPPLAALPAPGAELLAAQAAAARGGGQGLSGLDQQMRAYRRALFDRLQSGAGR